MNNQPLKHSRAWVTFIYAIFLILLAMIGAVVLFVALSPPMGG